MIPRHHGCTAVQAVVMVTPVLIGNGHFWTTVNKKRQTRLSSKYAQVITLAPSMYKQNLVATCNQGTARHIREVLHFCHFLTSFSSQPSLFFLRTSTGRTPEPMLMVDGLNDASWLKEVPFGYANVEKIHSGGLRPQKLPLFWPSREITAKTQTINNFETACYSHLLREYLLKKTL